MVKIRSVIEATVAIIGMVGVVTLTEMLNMTPSISLGW